MLYLLVYAVREYHEMCLVSKHCVHAVMHNMYMYCTCMQPTNLAGNLVQNRKCIYFYILYMYVQAHFGLWVSCTYQDIIVAL